MKESCEELQSTAEGHGKECMWRKQWDEEVTGAKRSGRASCTQMLRQELGNPTLSHPAGWAKIKAWKINNLQNCLIACE